MENQNNYQAITFTNEGYIEYTHNLLASIIKNSVEIDLKIFTLDENSFNYFNKVHKNVELLKDSSTFSNFLDQKSERFGQLMIKKFECIFKSLSSSEKVLYIDGDIVLKKNFINSLIRIMDKNSLDFIFQDDKNPKKPNLINVCAGFMLINSNKKTLKFFDPESLKIEKIVKYRTHDQTHINRNLSKFKYRVLPLHQFPNGPYFYDNYEKIDPAIVHFNYILGHEKIERMKLLQEWYL
tara:strand:- start:208 stop:921 length:714 start_codon:yes stop_codon:yes gene_type:complete